MEALRYNGNRKEAEAMYILVTLLYAITMGFIANSYLLIAQMTEILYILAPVFLFVNLFCNFFSGSFIFRASCICFLDNLTVFCIVIS